MVKKAERTKSGQLKDTRKPLTGIRLSVEGTFVGTFNGKLNPETKTLKIYDYYGDINRFGQAIEEYAFDHQISTVIVKFSF